MGGTAPADTLALCERWAADSEALVAAVLESPDGVAISGLPARQRALLAYAAKLTERPATIERADVDALRQAGLADADILALVEVIAYYAYANRIADGLGIELES